MGMNLVIISKKNIKPVLFGDSCGIPPSAAPFAEATRCILLLF